MTQCYLIRFCFALFISFLSPTYSFFLYFSFSLTPSLSLFLVFPLSLVLSSEDEERLVRDLFRDYNKLIRPVEVMNMTVEVQFGLNFIQLINVVSLTVCTLIFFSAHPPHPIPPSCFSSSFSSPLLRRVRVRRRRRRRHFSVLRVGEYLSCSVHFST